MPDNFGQTLKDGAARFADTVSPGPVGQVRARGERRRRRTTAAVAVAVAGAVIAVGAGSAYALGQTGRTDGPRPVSSITAPVPTSTPSNTPSSTPTGSPTARSTSSASVPATHSAPTSTASSGYASLAGEWKQTDGALEALYIFADGVIGVGQGAGLYYPLCAGTLEPPANGAYPFSDSCGSGTITLAGGTLTLHIPGTDGGAGSAVAYVPVAPTWVTATNGNGVPSWAVGLWSEGDERIAIDPSGAVSWSLTPQQGGMITGSGGFAAVPGGGYRITTSYGSPLVPGIWPAFRAADGGLVVIGGEGPMDFRLINAEWRFPA